MAEVHNNGLGNGKTIGGVTMAFAALGLFVAILAIAAAPFVGDVTPQGEEMGVGDVDNSALAAGTFAAASVLIPFVGAPLLAIGMGVWVGTMQRDAGRAWWTSAVGVLAGAIAMFILIAIGYAIGGAIADLPTVTQAESILNVQAAAFFDLSFFASAIGLVYVLTHLIVASVTAAVVAALMPEYRADVGATRAERRTAA